jgi:hypothetical protein
MTGAGNDGVVWHDLPAEKPASASASASVPEKMLGTTFVVRPSRPHEFHARCNVRARRPHHKGAAVVDSPVVKHP